MIQFKLYNVPALQRDLRALQFTTQQQVLTKAVREAAKMVRDRAAQLAPRDTGKLAGSMMYTSAGQRNALNRIVFLVGPSRDAYYGLFLEFGTAFIYPQPFLKPAFDQMEGPATAKMAEVIRAEINKRFGGASSPSFSGIPLTAAA